MKKIILTLTLAVLMFSTLLGCESADAHQHHLYYINGCKTTVTATIQDHYDGASPTERGDLQAGLQSFYETSVSECMANTEKTTAEYQQAKHDDYGKLSIQLGTHDKDGWHR